MQRLVLSPVPLDAGLPLNVVVTAGGNLAVLAAAGSLRFGRSLHPVVSKFRPAVLEPGNTNAAPTAEGFLALTDGKLFRFDRDGAPIDEFPPPEWETPPAGSEGADDDEAVEGLLVHPGFYGPLVYRYFSSPAGERTLVVSYDFDLEETARTEVPELIARGGDFCRGAGAFACPFADELRLYRDGALAGSAKLAAPCRQVLVAPAQERPEAVVALTDGGFSYFRLGDDGPAEFATLKAAGAILGAGLDNDGDVVFLEASVGKGGAEVFLLCNAVPARRK